MIFLLEIDSTNEHNKFVDEWSAHSQSDINLEHKGQVVADTGTNSDINLEHKGQVVADTGTNSDINLEHKSQVVADTRINRLIRTTHTGVGGPFFLYTVILSTDYEINLDSKSPIF